MYKTESDYCLSGSTIKHTVYIQIFEGYSFADYPNLGLNFHDFIFVDLLSYQV